MIARLKYSSEKAVVVKREETEGKRSMLSSPRKKGISSLFNEVRVRVFKVSGFALTGFGEVVPT